MRIECKEVITTKVVSHTPYMEGKLARTVGHLFSMREVLGSIPQILQSTVSPFLWHTTTCTQDDDLYRVLCVVG